MRMCGTAIHFFTPTVKKTDFSTLGGNFSRFVLLLLGASRLFRTFKNSNFESKNKNVKILWASTREPYNFLQAKQLGCHIITVPPLIINKIEKFGKKFSQLTKETVKGFLNDSLKSNFKI